MNLLKNIVAISALSMGLTANAQSVYEYVGSNQNNIPETEYSQLDNSAIWKQIPAIPGDTLDVHADYAYAFKLPSNNDSNYIALFNFTNHIQGTPRNDSVTSVPLENGEAYVVTSQLTPYAPETVGKVDISDTERFYYK